MQVKVDIETMTLKIMDCDPFEGAVMDMANGQVIEVILVDSSTTEDLEKDFVEAENQNAEQPKNAVLTINENELKEFVEQSVAQGKKPHIELNLGNLISNQFNVS
jgi:TusA-related sulfurtransferase